MKPGLHEHVTWADYCRLDAVHWSGLRPFARTAAHARLSELHEKFSDALRLGSAAHCAILEPNDFEVRFAKAPDVRRNTKAWADFEAEAGGRELLKPDEWLAAERMRDAVLAHPIAGELLKQPARREVTAVWSIDGIPCKGRLDWFGSFRGWPTVVDIKTTRDASQFARDVARYGYHGQAAFYLDGLSAIAEARRRWLWIVIEKDSVELAGPDGWRFVRVLSPDDETLEQGRRDYTRYMRLRKLAVESGRWDGYEVAIEAVSLPRWAINEGASYDGDSEG